MDGTEILLGQSTLQTFIDAGYRVTLDKSLEEDIAGEEMSAMIQTIF